MSSRGCLSAVLATLLVGVLQAAEPGGFEYVPLDDFEDASASK